MRAVGRHQRQWPSHRDRRQPEQPQHHLHRHGVGRRLAYARRGRHWTPIFDRAPALGVGDPGALAIDPIDTNILYVGTSSRDGSQFSGEATQPPAGLFKSTDGGASWVRLGSGYPSSAPSNASIFFNQLINVVIVDPANQPDRLPRIQLRRVRFPRWRLQLDPGSGLRRGRALAGTGPDLASPRSHLVCGHHRLRRVPVHRWGADTGHPILNATTPVVAEQARQAAELVRSSSRWRHRPRRPIPPASR